MKQLFRSRPGISNIRKVITGLGCLFIAGVSAWRALAIFRTESLNQPLELLLWGSLFILFTVFWLGALYIGCRLSKNMARRQWFAVGTGIVIFVLVGWLLSSPSGLSKASTNIFMPIMYTHSYLASF